LDTNDLDTRTLSALCDVFIPAVRPPNGAPAAFFALTASDAGTAARVAALLPSLLDAQALTELGTLLAVLRRAGVGRIPQLAAQALLAALSKADADASQGIDDLRQLTMAVHYGGVDAHGHNPTWEMLGYPGPAAVPARDGDRLPLVAPPPDVAEHHLEVDAVVVGSGAGGGVVAAKLAQAGRRVLVLEAGPGLQEDAFPRDEIGALRAMYWRGGLVSTDDGNVVLLAGATLGGGTTVNWSNCVPPPAHVLAIWQDEHGLDGVAGPAFQADLDAVATRIGVTASGTTANGPNQRLLEGAKALGWSAHMTSRNVDTKLEDAHATGATGFGDVTGAKRGSLRTWLPDACAAGADVMPHAEVHRVLVRDGHAIGVEAVFNDGMRQVRLTVHAPTVVLAAGALETPAILLRSGLGGPAAGRHLRLHPVPVIHGVYDEPQDAWSGPPQSVVVDEQSATYDGHGYLVEGPHWHPGLTAAALRWTDARDARVVMSRFSHMAPFIAVTRERGAGRVTLDASGASVVRHPLDDPLDQQVLAAAVRDLVRLHAAAGARTIVDFAPGRRVWRRGEPVEPFADQCAAVPFGKDGRPPFSAHQMGSARMGADARTSVADPSGQLHDTAGVWIGDASAFPTAVGSNPMLTVMALAHRTAARILADG
jgi:choline dehydrogenase-like flavoprotein